jgi:hypothetical protein
LDTLGLIGSFWTERVLEVLVENCGGLVELVLGRLAGIPIEDNLVTRMEGDDLGISEKALSDFVRNLRSLRHLTLHALLPPPFSFTSSVATPTTAASPTGLNTKAIERISSVADKRGILLEGSLIDQATERSTIILDPVGYVGPIINELEGLLSSLQIV